MPTYEEGIAMPNMDAICCSGLIFLMFWVGFELLGILIRTYLFGPSQLGFYNGHHDEGDGNEAFFASMYQDMGD